VTKRWLEVARKDFQYARRSNVFLVLVGIFTFLTMAIFILPGVLTVAFGDSLPADATTEWQLFQASATAGATVIPITALIAAYLSIAGERQSGRIRVLLSLPPSRQDVVIGKFVSRSVLMSIAIGVAYLVAVVVSVAFYRDLPLVTLFWTVGLSCLMATSFVGLAVGISAATRSRMQALALVLFIFVVTVVLWTPLLGAISGLVAFGLDSQPDGLIAFLDVFPPSSTFGALYDSLVGALVGPATESDAFYRSDPFLFVLLVAWAVVPVALGYVVFERVDLT